ncbi:MAG: tight adherence protein [Cryptosporangiaceae bacterium]|nr:tight adherence protein [Cryptosporangiaceae bacterium]
MTSSAAAAVPLAAAAVALAVGGGVPRARLAALAEGPAARRRLSLPRLPLWLLAAACGAGGWLAAGPVAGVAGALYGGAGGWMIRAHRRERADALLLGAALDAVAGLAADLRAGQLPARALVAALTAIDGAAGPHSVLTMAAAEADSPVAVAAALRSADEPALAGVLGRLAAIWSLADSGVPMADLLDLLDAELRARRRAGEKTAAQLAAARMTAALLGALPAVGLVLGQLTGAHPVRVLLHTVPGGVCAVVAMALHVAGAVWVQRIVTGAVLR